MMSVSIRSPIITVVSECASMPVERAAHHQRVGLADEVGLDGRWPCVISAATDPVAGSGPSARRPARRRGWWR